MNGSVLFCVLLLVGSASAWGWGGWSWWFNPWWSHGSNVRTECGKYIPTVYNLWDAGMTQTDVNTKKLLSLLKQMDVNNDGFLSTNEQNNLQIYTNLDSTLTFDTGVPRCNYVAFVKRYLNVDQEVANTLFTAVDTNGDEALSFSDSGNQTTDARTQTVCDVFRAYTGAIASAENRVFQTELKSQALIARYSQ